MQTRSDTRGEAPLAAPARPRRAGAAKPKGNGADFAALERHLRHSKVLLRAGEKVGSLDTLEEILEAIAQIATEELGCERTTFYLHDAGTRELYSVVAQGLQRREVRILDTDGVAGHVLHSGNGEVVNDAYADPRFDKSMDERLGYRTRSILCAPIRVPTGAIFGVVQCLNKREGDFSEDDLRILADIGAQATPSLRRLLYVEQMEKRRAKELEFVSIVSDITSELGLDALLQRVMSEATRLLDAERSTLFLHDDKTGELFSRVLQGGSVGEIRLPDTAGIAGAVFGSGRTINIPHAYADLRFNPDFDRRTGYFTRSILCTPLTNKQGKVIGVTQVLNKRGGPFTDEDEQRLKAFTAQVAIALENAKLFEDVQRVKNYNESMLESMSNGVVTLDEEERIATCNAAGLRILRRRAAEVVGRTAAEFFAEANAWVLERLRKVTTERRPDALMDVELQLGGEAVSANLAISPLATGDGTALGTMLLIEDISTEKRVKATMSRYMDPAIAAQMLEGGGADLLGGTSREATVLFSDIRGFTTITEELGAQGTVSFLNEYFSIMVDSINDEGGMLDKFIGDAIMAAFGLPVAHGDDADRAVRASIRMIRDCRRWSAERVAKGQKPVGMGIGLNTDVVVSGNIGSARRMDYTLIGDGVNLASRLEGACKVYSASILVSESTYKKLRGSYRIRQVDRVIVKGKTEPAAVFEILDHHEDDGFPNIMEVVGDTNEGQKHFRVGDFEKAASYFREAAKLHPADGLTKLYLERCSILMKDKPPKDWNGVWVMKEK